VTASDTPHKSAIVRESTLFAVLLLVGLLLLPVAIYLVGQLVFGEFGGAGLTGFIEGIYRGILAGNSVIWFLFLSPYLGWQVMRLTFWLFRRTAAAEATGTR
jgi:hypothetical protein